MGRWVGLDHRTGSADADELLNSGRENVIDRYCGHEIMKYTQAFANVSKTTVGSELR